VDGILSNIASIIKSFKKITQIKNLSASEINYLKGVYNNLTAACLKSLTALADLLTDNIFQMPDNERINTIDSIYEDMDQKYAFSEAFIEEATLLSAQRQNEWNQINFLKILQ
jgi:hypothetical protein